MIELIKPFASPMDKHHDWQQGDAIVAVDDKEIDDILDFYFYMPQGEAMTLTIRREGGEESKVTLLPGALDMVTSCFAAIEFKTCACDCVFCFIDQNPEGMRPNIYVKDEDYRLSFLYGNYITLTSMGARGIQRILDQKMTPLFVSVHATDIDVRTRMLGIKKRMDIMAVLKQLTDGGIEIHSQIVLCPGWNDGDILEKSLTDLYSLYPGVASLAIVPVGLTDHRAELTDLDPVTPEIAAWTIDVVEKWQKKAQAEFGDNFVFLSDEFYLHADRQFPPLAEYGEMAQLDNGIGLTSYLRDIWTDDLETAAADGRMPKTAIAILTGHSAKMAFDDHMPQIFTNSDLPKVQVVPVDNHHYGRSVTVAGLLSGADVRRTLQQSHQQKVLDPQSAQHVCLPSRMFNSDDLTLDNMTIADIGQDLPYTLHAPPEEGFVDFWANIG
jgi:putative radical SAM enzyme (TIGR03279 family)